MIEKPIRSMYSVRKMTPSESGRAGLGDGTGDGTVELATKSVPGVTPRSKASFPCSCVRISEAEPEQLAQTYDRMARRNFLNAFKSGASRRGQFTRHMNSAGTRPTVRTQLGACA